MLSLPLLCVPSSLIPPICAAFSPLSPPPLSPHAVYLTGCAPVFRQSGERRRALSLRSLTLVTGTNCPLLLAYTAGKLRTCEGTKFNMTVRVHMCVASTAARVIHKTSCCWMCVEAVRVSVVSVLCEIRLNSLV